jgi:hypothetical protein
MFSSIATLESITETTIGFEPISITSHHACDSSTLEGSYSLPLEKKSPHYPPSRYHTSPPMNNWKSHRWKRPM